MLLETFTLFDNAIFLQPSYVYLHRGYTNSTHPSLAELGDRCVQVSDSLCITSSKIIHITKSQTLLFSAGCLALTLRTCRRFRNENLQSEVAA